MPDVCKHYVFTHDTVHSEEKKIKSRTSLNKNRKEKIRHYKTTRKAKRKTEKENTKGLCGFQNKNRSENKAWNDERKCLVGLSAWPIYTSGAQHRTVHTRMHATMFGGTPGPSGPIAGNHNLTAENLVILMHLSSTVCCEFVKCLCPCIQNTRCLCTY